MIPMEMHHTGFAVTGIAGQITRVIAITEKGEKMRLIDADALTKMLNRHEKDCNPDHFDGHETFIDKINAHDSYGEWQFANGFNLGIVASIVDTKNVPTIDAVLVVRCKDCIHWYRGYGENKCLEFADIPLEPNDFCSRGERKDDET